MWLNSAQVIRKCLTVKGSLQGMQNGWMDGYFVYRRSTLKGRIASNKFYVMMILFNEKFKNIYD